MMKVTETKLLIITRKNFVNVPQYFITGEVVKFFVISGKHVNQTACKILTMHTNEIAQNYEYPTVCPVL